MDGYLAVGDVNGDGVDDLLIGAPGAQTLGTPIVPSRLSGSMLPADHLESGVVLAYLGQTGAGAPLAPSVVYGPDEWSMPGSHQGAQFGATIETGDFNDDGCVDVAVGAPTDPDVDVVAGDNELLGDHGSPIVETGRVYILSNAGWGSSCTDPLLIADTLDVEDENSLFGQALAVGGLSASGAQDDLAVGAPGATDVVNGQLVSGVGAVLVYVNSESHSISFGSYLLAIQESTSTIPGECAEVGDEFGGALAIAHRGVSGSADLLVGAPGDGVGCTHPPPGVGEGMVFEFRGGTFLREYAPLSSPLGAAGSRFGDSIAWTDRDDADDALSEVVIIGAPFGSLTYSYTGVVSAHETTGAVPYLLSQEP